MAIALHLNFHPFAAQVVNRIELGTLIAVYVTQLVSMIYLRLDNHTRGRQESPGSVAAAEVEETLVTVALMAVNILMCAVLLYYACREAFTEVKAFVVKKRSIRRTPESKTAREEEEGGATTIRRARDDATATTNVGGEESDQETLGPSGRRVQATSWVWDAPNPAYGIELQSVPVPPHPRPST